MDAVRDSPGQRMDATAASLESVLSDLSAGKPDVLGPGGWGGKIDLRKAAISVLHDVETARLESQCFSEFMRDGVWNRFAYPRRTIVQAYAQWREAHPQKMPPIETADLAVAVTVLRREHHKRGTVHAGPGDGMPLLQCADPRNPPWTYVHDTCLRALARECGDEGPAGHSSMCALAGRLLNRSPRAVAERWALVLGQTGSAPTGASGKRKTRDDAGGDAAAPHTEPTLSGGVPITSTAALAKGGAGPIIAAAAKEALQSTTGRAKAVLGRIDEWARQDGPTGLPDGVHKDTVATRVKASVEAAEQEAAMFAEFAAGGRYHIRDRMVDVRSFYKMWRSAEAERRGCPALEEADLVTDALVLVHRAVVRQQLGQGHACSGHMGAGPWTIVEDAVLRALVCELAQTMSFRAISTLAAGLLPHRSAQSVRPRMRLLGCAPTRVERVHMVSHERHPGPSGGGVPAGPAGGSQGADA
jgi:hypothetical protein